MTATTTQGIQTFEVRETQTQKFLNKLQELKFSEITTEEKLFEATENPKVKPKRATFDNILQQQYRCIFKNGDTVHVHVSMHQGKFVGTGTAWVLMIDTKTGRKIFRVFPRTTVDSLMFRLSAYVQLFVKIIENRPENVILFEKRHDSFFWRSVSGDRYINFLNYAKSLPKDFCAYVTKREKASAKWLEKNQNRKRRRAIRSVYKLVK